MAKGFDIPREQQDAGHDAWIDRMSANLEPRVNPPANTPVLEEAVGRLQHYAARVEGIDDEHAADLRLVLSTLAAKSKQTVELEARDRGWSLQCDELEAAFIAARDEAEAQSVLLRDIRAGLGPFAEAAEFWDEMGETRFIDDDCSIRVRDLRALAALLARINALHPEKETKG